jgi:hypothetical protein
LIVMKCSRVEQRYRPWTVAQLRWNVVEARFLETGLRLRFAMDERLKEDRIFGLLHIRAAIRRAEEEVEIYEFKQSLGSIVGNATV